MAIYSKLSADQGADFRVRVQLVDSLGNDLSLIGYTTEGSIKKTYSSLISYEMLVNIANADLGIIALSVSGAVTSGMNAGRYVYDIYVTSPSGIKTRVLEGQFEITPGVTL